VHEYDKLNRTMTIAYKKKRKLQTKDSCRFCREIDDKLNRKPPFLRWNSCCVTVTLRQKKKILF